MGSSSFLMTVLTDCRLYVCMQYTCTCICTRKYIYMFIHMCTCTELQVPTCACACDCSLPSALDFNSLPRCPQESGMGACRFPTAGKGGGEVLGYLLSDITEEVTGVLRLSYYNGAKCSSGKSHVVNILFQCEKGAGVVSDMNICITYVYMYVCIFFCVYICWILPSNYIFGSLLRAKGWVWLSETWTIKLLGNIQQNS